VGWWLGEVKGLDSKRVWAVVMAVASIVTMAAAPVAADSDAIGTVNRTYGLGLRVRAEPGVGHSVLAVAPQGAQLKVSGEPIVIAGREWRQVTFGEVTGWVASQYLDLVTPTASSEQEAQANEQNIPTPPASDAGATAASTPTGTASQTGERPDASGRDGRQDGEVANAIVEQALSLVGRPYRMGGAGPNAFDCAGLVYFVYRPHGIDLPRDAAGQWSRGAAVDRSALRPGDLVFFRNTYIWGISHVGIYVGNGKFVHAVDEWTGVTISSLDEGLWPQHYAGARRVLP